MAMVYEVAQHNLWGTFSCEHLKALCNKIKKHINTKLIHKLKIQYSVSIIVIETRVQIFLQHPNISFYLTKDFHPYHRSYLLP